MMDSWSLLVTISSSLCVVFQSGYLYFKTTYNYWEKKGIRGPKPLPILGNFASVMLRNRLEREREWAKNYGKVYGIYHGSRPRLVIADAEVLVQVCIKDFDAFTNHEMNEFFNKFQKGFLIFLQGDHWKKVRALMSPTFTSGKIKRMFKFLDGCADDLVQCFDEQLQSTEEKSGSIVNLKDLYELFAMDAITTCCYGLKLERAGSANLKTAATRNDFVRVALKLFDYNPLRFLAMAAIPKPILRFVGFELVPEKGGDPLAKVVTKMVDNRRNSPKKFDDYLQLLVDAKLDDKMELDDMDLKENHHAGLTQESMLEDQKKMVEEIQKRAGGKDIALSDLEVLGGGIFLLAVGLETTGTLLANCSYALAFHQNIQQRLYDEVLKLAEFNEDKTKFSFTYEALTSCQFLDAVISETLRFLPPVVMIDRVANRDYHIKKYNIDIPEGSKLNLAFYSILNDPDYWHQPEKFNPERFMPGNKEKIVPGSYCPFGIGPRHCLGMRFSLTEAKLALAKIMMNFQFEPAPNTTFPPSSMSTFSINNISNPSVTLLQREKNRHSTI